MQRATILFLLSTLATTGAAAQTPSLAKFGGAAPGVTTLTVEGTPGAVYLLLGATEEVTTPLFTGAVLDIPLGLLATTISLPGFLGVLDGYGEGVGTLALPSDASLWSMTLSLQALVGPLFDTPSNLVRVTPQAPESFRATLEAAPLPTFGGSISTLADGSVLIVEASATATQSYDADREEFALGWPIVGGGLFSTATALDDGRVLVTGGLDLAGAPTADAGVFDPTTGSFTALSMATPRAGHAATRLGDGRVLVSGGLSQFDLADLLGTITAVLNSTELFDPSTNTFSAGANMLEGRAFHTSSELGNGGALIAGGLATLPIINVPTVSNTAYAYNPNSNSFGLPALFSTGRFLHSAVTQDDGRVLLVGGLSVDLTAYLASQDLADLVIGALDDVQRYQPGFFGGFSTVGTLGAPRAGAGVVKLPGGGALVVGGFELTLGGGAFGLAGSAAADRVGGSGVTPLADMAETRILPLCTQLDDGTILVVGGGTTSATVFQP
ncbi:MAG: kelch repeat-containing protein [Planctomycetota bacterium]